MNIFLHELKAYRKSTIIWTFSLVALMILMLSMFPAFANNAAEVKKLLASYPPALRKAIGLSLDNIFTLVGFYSYVFTYIILCGAIQAMNLGTSIISKEVREKTADFLLTKPVSRTQIITAKLLAALTSLVITNVIYLAAASMMAAAVKTTAYSGKIFFLISLSLFLVQLIFLAMGVIVSLLVAKIKSVISVSLGTVFGFFIISMFGSVIGDDKVRYITPFKYFDSAYIIKNVAYETSLVIIAIVFVVAAIVGSYFIYAKKDIQAV